MKKIISVLLTAAILISTFSVAVFAQETSAELYELYSDGMLFQQNEQATVAGTSNAGNVISLIVKDSSGKIEATGTSTVKDDKTFAVCFDAPAGSFSEYTVEVYENGTQFEKLEHVVFGELWLASGQSNMAYSYRGSKNYVTPSSNATERKSWVRLLNTPAVPSYNGSTEKVPSTAQKDIAGCEWFDANDNRADYFSAVGYYFAVDLIESLDVPLGVVSNALAGSSIISWLPREAIESSPVLMKVAQKMGIYIPLDEWNEDSIRIWCDSSALYNTKAAPLHNFRFNGMIWYQGESEVQMKLDKGVYTEAFALLQKYYSEILCPGKTLPIVFTQLASYYYGANDSIFRQNAEYAEIQRKSPKTRALVTQYDYSTTFNNFGNSEHPETKKPIGTRMSYAAQGLVYGKHGSYSAATVDSFEAKNGGIYVKFNDVGDGLVIDGISAKGFSVAGKDGVYYRANAKIIDNDTIFISNPDVSSPVSAAYADYLSNYESNLYSSENGARTLPVCPFVLDFESVKISLLNNSWMQCDSAEAWHVLERQSYNAFYDTWKSDNAQMEISSDSAYEGDAGLAIQGSGNFSVSPLMNIKSENDRYVFSDVNTNWSKYGKLSVMIRNDGDKDVKLKSLSITDLWFIRIVPTVDGSMKTSAVIPADGQWHKIVFDLNSTSFLGLKFKSIALRHVTNVKFSFSAQNACISIDGIRFSPSTQKAGLTEKISDFFSRLFSSIC